MTFAQIVLLMVGALVYARFVPPRWRMTALLIVSVAAVYLLQPAAAIRGLGYWLPTLALGMIVLVWAIVQPENMVFITRKESADAASNAARQTNRRTLMLVAGGMIVFAATRYLAPELRPLLARPPELPVALAAAGTLIAACTGVGALARRAPQTAITVGIIALIAMFVVLKTPALAETTSAALRTTTGQTAAEASAVDLSWLGFSYLAFRLLHLLFDARERRLPSASLAETLTFALFFPAYTAGPLDRIERAQKDFAALPTADLLTAQRWTIGLGRIAVGLFKKFVIADSLALVALSSANADQALHAGALWLLVYAFALRLWLDFSGYSDIAIGLAYLYGVYLPENFDRPYLKQNIAVFWQSWHMTLSAWARSYVFAPISRALMLRKTPMLVAVFASQMATMVVIGLWHGVTVNFVVWGVWHGAGLFVHKLWSDRTRTWYLSLKTRPRVKAAWTVAGVLLTFHFVALGWVWFALPDTDTALLVMARLFGAGR